MKQKTLETATCVGMLLNLFIPGALVDQYMAAHGELNNRHPLVFEFLVFAVLHVQPHDLGVSLREPLLVHVEDPR